MPAPSNEPLVSMSCPMPKGYTFVRKGNVYITKHCRKLTQEANRPVYVVEDKRGRKQGLRVPQHIYDRIRRSDAETKETRADTVRKKDLALETKVRQELLRLFPCVPAHGIEPILDHTLKKRSGRVGRSKNVPLKEMVMLAVRAHIRHKHTHYDALLRQGTNRQVAREMTAVAVDKKITEWAGKPMSGTRNPLSSRDFVRPVTATSSQKAPKKAKLSTSTSTVSSKRRRPQNGQGSNGKGFLRRRSLRVEQREEQAESEDLDMMDND